MRLTFKHGMSDYEKNIRGPKIQQLLKQGLQPGKITWPQLIFSVNGVSFTFTPTHTGFDSCSFIGKNVS